MSSSGYSRSASIAATSVNGRSGIRIVHQPEEQVFRTDDLLLPETVRFTLGKEDHTLRALREADPHTDLHGFVDRVREGGDGSRTTLVDHALDAGDEVG